MGTHDSLFEDMKSVQSKVPPKDAEFFNSLLSQYAIKGVWSSKQAYWVDKLVTQYKAAGETAEPVAESSETIKAKDLSKLTTWFDTAAKKLKYPTIHMDLEGFIVQIKRTRAGRYPGSFSVASKTKTDDLFIGWAKPDGTVIMSKTAEADYTDFMVDLMNGLGYDPIKFVQDYGRKTGFCCFCNSKLENEGSTEVGYGPHCAKIWNLPWSPKKKKEGASTE